MDFSQSASTDGPVGSTQRTDAKGMDPEQGLTPAICGRAFTDFCGSRV